MKFEEILSFTRNAAGYLKADGVPFLAVQVNFTGDEGGVLYVEVKDGKVSVEPYEYNDRSCAITISMDDFSKLIVGKLDPVAAFTTGKLKVEGDIGKALEFANLMKKSR